VCDVQPKAVVQCLCCLIVVSFTPSFPSHVSFLMLPIRVVQLVLILLGVAIVSFLLQFIVIQT
jgi:hypothetical protein